HDRAGLPGLDLEPARDLRHHERPLQDGLLRLRDRDHRLLERSEGRGRRVGGRGRDDPNGRAPFGLRARLRLLLDQALPRPMSANPGSAVSAPTPGPGPQAIPDTIVEFKNVWKRYSGKEILAGVNLQIRRGEILCVLGPSGTGKSVTLRHI